jgi:hypothetical protein
MGKIHTKFLLTEGREDAYAIAGLMSNYVRWGTSEDEWPVKIEAAGSAPELLRPDYLGPCFKRSGLEAIGILLDANEDPAGRWASLQNLCSTAFPGIPDALPAEGLIHLGQNGIRLGVWIMPDNRSSGMLETFLVYLVPKRGRKLWDHAIRTCDTAKSLGAPFRDAHEDKARIHTWLAWRDPPGRPFGEALKSKCLDPSSPAAKPFANWFIRLFALDHL